MKTTDRFIWIAIVVVMFTFWWIATIIDAPWWIISLTCAIGILAWLQTHETSHTERYYAFLLVIVVISTLYHKYVGVQKIHEGYANGPTMEDPSAPNMNVNELTAQIKDLEDKLAKSSHHQGPAPDTTVSSDILSQFLTTSSASTGNMSSGGSIKEQDLSVTLGKDEKTLPRDDTPMDNYSPAQAQRATYQLVNTVQQLKETMENLGPVLKEGKHVMSMFENLNLGDTMKQLDNMSKMGDMKEDQMNDFMKMMQTTDKKTE
jgi:hypothetical protein